MSKELDRIIERIDDKKIRAQAKRLKKVLERAQKENSAKKKKLTEELKSISPSDSRYLDLTREIDDIKTISNGTKKTYFETSLKILKEVSEEFGVREFKKIKPEYIEKIINNRIEAGQSASTIQKAVHSVKFFEEHAQQVGVYKKELKITDHEKNLKLLKERGMRRRSTDSKRYKATYSEAEAVIREMERYNPQYANIARYQLLTGFRISDTVRQKASNISEDKHICHGSKGGLTNTVYVNHHTLEDKEFIDYLVKRRDSETGRIFERKTDDFGRYFSDRSTARAVTQLSSKCAKKLGIKGKNGETFSSHSFRGAFAHERMKFYAKSKDKLDLIIKQKISEQPRLKKRYQSFEERIRRNVKPKKRRLRKIHDYEKVQWLVSTDLNHSRQDVVRYYVPISDIKKELSK